MIYVDGGRDTVVVILHDIRMCQELEWYHSCGLCMCLIDYTSGYLMLYGYIIFILYIIYIKCYLHDETLFLFLN